MGSFDYTCGVSGMPIRVGENVRYMLVTENPYAENRTTPVTSMDVWFPRTFPLRATYNDYGGVRDMEEGPQQEIWLEALRSDMVERDVGDNTVHDVALRKSMPLQQILEAIPSGRLLVQQKRFSSSGDKVKVPVGVPTRARVERRLRKGGKHVFDPVGRDLQPPDALIVERIGHGVVRVRVSCAKVWGSDDSVLEDARAALKDYATIVTAGSGPYARRAEMLVFATSGAANGYFQYGDHFRSRRTKTRESRVGHVMIREDVWQALLMMGSGRMANLGAAYKKTQQAIRTYNDPLTQGAILGLLGDSLGDSVTTSLVARHNIMGTSFHEHWKLFAKRGISVKEAESFLRTVAETGAVVQALLDIRFVWRPSGSAGEQFGTFDKHYEFYRLMANVADCRLEEQKRDYGDDDA